MNFRSARNPAALLPPSPSSLTITPAARGGRAAKSTTQVAACARPDRARVDAEVGQRQGLHRLLLRRHDPLERRVPRLVDLLHHADHRRQRPVTTAYPSSVTRRIVTSDPAMSTFDASVSCGTPEPLGHHRRHHPGPRVGRLRPDDHQVEPDLPERRGQRQRRRQRVRPGQAVVGHVHRLVRAHRQRLADRLGRLAPGPSTRSSPRRRAPRRSSGPPRSRTRRAR